MNEETKKHTNEKQHKQKTKKPYIMGKKVSDAGKYFSTKSAFLKCDNAMQHSKVKKFETKKIRKNRKN